MCGLAGIFNHRSGEPVSRGDLEGMARRIAHRGPDGEGFYLDGALGFAHRRLAILDREGGAQPMISAAGTVLVFNGEIYNYQEIFAELKRRGRSPETRSDTEALLLAYDEWGLEFVDRLTGMFALALWDARRRRLVLCRDRLGIKPLYLAETPAGLVFGSEVKALWSLPGVDASIDVTALDEYMSLGFVLGPRTMMRGVRKLDAGTLVTVEMGGRPAARRYWSLRFDPDPVPDARAWADEVRAVFEDVTRLHLLRDVPLGVLLSGGLDSSVIAATVAQRPDVCSLESFTVSVDIPGAISEQRWARQVADAVGATHHERRLSEVEHTALLHQVAERLDQPIADPMCAQLYSVCQLARDAGIKVLLSGEGADELFFGYRVYPNMALVEQAQQLVPPALLRGVIAPALRRAAGALGHLPKLAKLLTIAGEPLSRRYLGVNFFEPALKARLYRGDVAASLRGHDVLATVARRYDGSGGPEPLAQMAAFDCGAWLVDSILFRSDLMSMAASLEMRVPFLDHRLVELAARIPARHKVHGRTGKVVLRRAFADRVPEAVLTRPKIGFSTPLRELFRLGFGHEAEELLTAPGATTSAFFERAAVRRLFAEHRAGRDHSRTLHQIYALESWGRAVARRERAPAPP